MGASTDDLLAWGRAVANPLLDEIERLRERARAALTPAPDPVPDPEPELLPRVMFGMASPRSQWDERLAQVGAGVKARRLFASSVGDLPGILTVARAEVAEGRYPVVSAKVPVPWYTVADGGYDEGLDRIAVQLSTLTRGAFTIHHEPTGDGTAADYAAMTVRWLRRLKPSLPQLDLGPIVNGFWWSAGGQGYRDDEIAGWLPDELLAASDVIACDTYHGGTTLKLGEDASPKIRRFSEWATRKGVERMGLGEFSGLTAGAITAACDAVKTDPRFVYACIYNSSVNNREGVDWTLAGDRLIAFQTAIAD